MSQGVLIVELDGPARRDGNNVYYRVVDPCVPILLDRGMCLIECWPE